MNPREVKRLLNAYTIQLKMLSARGIVIDPDVVLALQTIGFRRDWEQVYQRLTTEPELMIEELRAASVAGVSDTSVRIPGELVDYVHEAAPGLLTEQLEPYISSARSVGESDIGLLEAQTQVARLLHRLDDLQPENVSNAVTELGGGISRLFQVLEGRPDRAVARAGLARTRDLESSMKRLEDPKITEEDLEVWASDAREWLNEIDDALRVLRRQTSVRALA